MSVLAGDDIDRVEAADHRAVLAVARETRVDVHLVSASVNDVAPLPRRMIPLGERTGREPLGLHVALVEDDERVRGQTHRGKIKRRLERRNIARVERSHELVEDFLRGDYGGGEV